jgi:uncharacterized membrane protein
MRATLLENATVALAAVALGVMAGFFSTYSFSVAPALLGVDGATYASVQSALNRHVRHALFFVFFFGAAALPALALVVNRRHWRSAAFWLVAAAGLAYALGVVAYTANVNLPLNHYTESWNPQALPADWAATRDAWNAANAVRVAVSVSAFVASLAALVLRPSQR